jgi:hypothetical protein
MAKQLKQINHKEIHECTTLTYIISFDGLLLRTKCMKLTAHCDPDINLDHLVRENFSPNQLWVSCNVLCNALKQFGKLHGFYPIFNRNTIRYNSYGCQDCCHTYQSGQLRVGCTLTLTSKHGLIPKQNQSPKSTLVQKRSRKQ